MLISRNFRSALRAVLIAPMLGSTVLASQPDFTLQQRQALRGLLNHITDCTVYSANQAGGRIRLHRVECVDPVTKSAADIFGAFFSGYQGTFQRIGEEIGDCPHYGFGPERIPVVDATCVESRVKSALIELDRVIGKN